MTDPFFVADIETLKSELRLTGTSYCDDVQTILERALLWARLKMFREVGEDQMNTVQAIAYTANPTTADQIRRASANLMEIECVYCYLLDTLPVVFKDASGNTQQIWNDLGTFRDTDSFDREQLKEQCQNRVAELVDAVRSDDDYQEDVRAFTQDSSCEGAPQRSVFPCAEPFSGAFKRRRLNADRFYRGDGGHG